MSGGISDGQQALLMFRGVMASLPEEDQAAIQSMANRIKAIMAENQMLGCLAVGLVGAEMSASME